MVNVCDINAIARLLASSSEKITTNEITLVTLVANISLPCIIHKREYFGQSSDIFIMKTINCKITLLPYQSWF